MPRKKMVFISHIHSEAELAQSLKAFLEKHFLGLFGIFVSSDRETIQAGVKWLDAIGKALRTADLQIVLCSKESIQRPWVNFEAGAVWLRGIPVVPVCHSGVKPTDLPVPLGMLEGIECGQPEGLKKLYDALADELKVSVPEVDFGAMAGELREIEKRYVRARQGAAIVHNPRILCAASEQYSEPRLGFQRDVGMLEKTFPGRVEIEPRLTRTRLRNLLTRTDQRFDVVHLVLFVDPENGDLIFDPVDLTTHKPAPPSSSRMSPEGFADLLVESGASLVVLATCKALLLAVEVAHVTNMAASDAIINGEQAEEWAECFYGLLAQGKPLFKAFDLTRSQSDVPIRAIRKRDVIFSLAEEGRRDLPQ